MNPFEFINSYFATHGILPSAQEVAQAANIPFETAENLLLSHQEGHGAIIPKEVSLDVPEQKTKRRKAKKDESKLDAAIVAFTHAIRYIAFVVSSLADIGLGVFFYWSLGFDSASKWVLAAWGLVQGSGKVWAWTEGKKAVALWSATLSVIATVSIFLAVIDTQSASVTAGNTQIVQAIENQISAKESENETLRVRLANTPSDFTTAAKTITQAMNMNDTMLSELRAELAKNQDQKQEFKLDSWTIFSQLTNFKWNDPSHIFALALILALAVFFEMLICVTTPRRMK